MKRKRGRPPLFKTPEELQEKIDQYFKDGMALRKVVCGSSNNRYIEHIPVPTITGLCLYLGFESRQSFYTYGKKEEFSYTIKKARLRIEREYEEQLQVGAPTGSIFALKNFNWKDIPLIDQSQHITKIEVKISDDTTIPLTQESRNGLPGTRE